MNAPFLFQVWECTQDECCFRFPVRAGSLQKVQCPRCGGPLVAAGTPFSPQRPRAEPPARRPAVDGLLDNIRSILNVGAIFRAADGAGLERLHLCGITATPDHPKLAKTALGAERTVPWHYHPNSLNVARRLRGEGYRLLALESHRTSSSLFGVHEEIAGDAPLLLIVGNERAGVDPAVLDLCDRVLHIPMEGLKSSLNVSIAFGIAAYHLRFNALPRRH